ncbi:hypothetical protein [Actinocorallia libanotica]|uniref:Amidophosphoribosyltransferase n=1 Tax=Actinocorallia libanotica TaxID=46162 RepID=A0ABP4BU45_9ACTN
MNAPPPSNVSPRFKQTLATYAGGYLRNTVRLAGVTCEVCATPYDRSLCNQCSAHRTIPGIADRVCSLTYALGGTQSGYLMRGYKAPRPVGEHTAVVTGLMMLGGSHNGCAERLAGMPITHWSFVPSLPGRPGEHPFARAARAAAQGLEEVRLAAAETVRDKRAVRRDHFRTERLPSDAHVLLMDDTWVAGGHAQSAALTLRDAGVKAVSIMTAARWIKPDYRGNREFLRTHLQRDFDPEICPWTGSTCPR